MNFKKFKVSRLMILAICLLLVTGIIYYYEEIKEPELEVETVDVIVAVKDIKENTVINSDMVALEKRYKSNALKQNDLLLDINAVIGKRARVPLYKGEVINYNRIIEDKLWMRNLDEKQISLNLAQNDKAIDINIGDYVDLWIEPKMLKDDAGNILLANKIFDKLHVIMVKDINYQNKETNNDFVQAFITIQLNNEQLKEFLEIDKNKYEIRIAKYGEEQFYKASDINFKNK